MRAFGLVDGTYSEAGRARGEEAFRAEWPFEVEIVSANLVAKLRSR